MSTAWQTLSVELRDHDRWGHFDLTREHPVHALLTRRVAVCPYLEILLRSLDWALETSEVEMVLRALSEPGLAGATKRVLALFSVRGTGQRWEELLWTAGSAVYTISSRDHLAELLTICRRRSLGAARQMLVLHLARFKGNEEVFQTLISLLHDDSVNGHALMALWQYGDVRGIPVIQSTSIPRYYGEAKAEQRVPLCRASTRPTRAEQNEPVKHARPDRRSLTGGCPRQTVRCAPSHPEAHHQS
jgi:hypothetical protein